MNTISKKWALLIVNALGYHQKLRFKRIMDELHTISPKMLSDVLKRLEKENLIKRETFNEIPPKVEYSLTEDGKELRRAVIPLLEWMSKRHSPDKKKCVALYKKINAHKIRDA